MRLLKRGSQYLNYSALLTQVTDRIVIRCYVGGEKTLYRSETNQLALRLSDRWFVIRRAFLLDESLSAFGIPLNIQY